MIQAFIFDLDGVIVDTAKYHFLAWRRLANELGFDFGPERNEQLKGVGRMESLEMILEWGGLDLPPERKLELTDLKNGWYQEYIHHMDRREILAGVLDFLGECSAAGIRMAVGSSSRNAGTIIEQLQLSAYFEAVIDGDKLTRSKPDPQVFLLAAAELELPPAACVVFEDAAAGIEAARNGKFHAVGVGDPVILSEADLVIPGFLQLHPADIIRRLSPSMQSDFFLKGG